MRVVGIGRKRQRRHWRRAIPLAGLLILLVAAQFGAAQSHGAAQLTVSITVQPSIQLVFQNSTSVGSKGYCPLTNANTNNAGLDLGSAWILGIQNSPCAGYAMLRGGLQYQVSSGYNVMVTKANSSSTSYRLAAEISTAPPPGVTWLINNNTLNNTTYTMLGTADTYGTANPQTLQVQVPWTAPAGTLQETITYLATAN